MSNIGTLKLNANGTYSGNLNLLTVPSISLELQINENKTEEKQPDFLIFSKGCQFGAAWKKLNKKGEEYLSLSFESPEVPFWANLGKEADKTGRFSLIWNKK
jgi:uncharacterized protein (DUF736 family)